MNTVTPFRKRGQDIKLVKQDSRHSCGLACIAMVLGIDMDFAREIIGRTCEEIVDGLLDDSGNPHPEPYLGITPEEIQFLLFQRGIPSAIFTDLKYYPEGHWYRIGWDRLTHPKFDDVQKHIARGGTAILGVPSLNIPDGSHWLVMSEGEIFDPSTKRTYDGSQQMEIDQAVLIGSRP